MNIATKFESSLFKKICDAALSKELDCIVFMFEMVGVVCEYKQLMTLSVEGALAEFLFVNGGCEMR